MKVLAVCLGNICRSPLAEGILAHKNQAYSLGWEVDSAGTAAYHVGELPDSRSISMAAKYGIDITNQRARQFKVIDFDRFDKILVMDRSNYGNVLSLARNEEDRKKVELILNYSKPGADEEVPDPYWDDNGFEHVYQLLDEATEVFIKENS